MNKYIPNKRKPFGRVGIDLDGTLAELIWPKEGIGKVNKSFLPVVEYYKKKKIPMEIFTANSDKKREAIGNWLKDNGFSRWIKRVQCGKPGFDVMWDDRAANPYCSECRERELK